jgi:hypothetical protein
MVHMRLSDLRLRAGDPRGARAHVEAMRRSRSPGELAAMRDVLVEVMEASVVLAEYQHERDADAVRASGERLLAVLRATGDPSPFQAHGTAIGYGALAVLDLGRGDRDAAGRHIREGYRQALGTRDLPVLAAVGMAVAEVALATGRPLAAAEMVGAAARLRGAEDPGSPWVRRLVADGRRRAGEGAWDEAYARGRAMSRAEAIARLDPDRADVLADGLPDGYDPGPRQGDGVVGPVGAGQARRR